MTTRDVKRGEMYFAAIYPTVGSEQDGVRPVLILQNNVGNKHSETTIVAGITSRTTSKAKLPTHFYLEPRNGLKQKSLVLLEQIKTIDKRRLRQYIGTLNPKLMKGIDQRLSISLGLYDEVK